MLSKLVLCWFRKLLLITMTSSLSTMQSDVFNLPDQPIKCILNQWEVAVWKSNLNPSSLRPYTNFTVQVVIRPGARVSHVSMIILLLL
jgi:hypothetical protein